MLAMARPKPPETYVKQINFRIDDRDLARLNRLCELAPQMSQSAIAKGLFLDALDKAIPLVRS